VLSGPFNLVQGRQARNDKEEENVEHRTLNVQPRRGPEVSAPRYRDFAKLKISRCSTSNVEALRDIDLIDSSLRSE